MCMSRRSAECPNRGETPVCAFVVHPATKSPERLPQALQAALEVEIIQKAFPWPRPFTPNPASFFTDERE